jgi:hypothetical protein
MQTEIREAAENLGDEFFRAMRDRDGATLIFILITDRGSEDILPEDPE